MASTSPPHPSSRAVIEVEIAFVVMKPKRSETKGKYVPLYCALGSELHTGRLQNRFINSFKVRPVEVTARVYTLLEIKKRLSEVTELQSRRHRLLKALS